MWNAGVVEGVGIIDTVGKIVESRTADDGNQLLADNLFLTATIQLLSSLTAVAFLV